MSLTCCVAHEPGCSCELNPVCGGIHAISSQCTVHARTQFTSIVHEVGHKRTTDIAPPEGALL